MRAVASIDELEAALQARWDPETAAVYADALIARGDPRGELIALDLYAEQHGSTPELEQQRRERLAAWLGSDKYFCLPWETRASWPSAIHEMPHRDLWWREHVRFGMLEHYTISERMHPAAEDVAALFASPAAPYLRSVHIDASSKPVAAVLQLLAARSLPWLRRLAITQEYKGHVPEATIDAFVAAAPHLEELSLKGVRIVKAPAHPNVRTLRLVGRTALVVGAAAMPRVTEIDLVFVNDHDVRRWLDPEPHRWLEYAPLLNPRLFPALERLDLSHNEYQWAGPLFPFVHAIEGLERIAQLRIPSLSDEDAVAALALLERYPRLEISVVGMYHQPRLPDGAGHPRLHVPALRPWLPGELVARRGALDISPPDDKIAPPSCAELLEEQFDAMSPDAQAAWAALWDFLDGLGWDDVDGRPIELPFDAATLLRAFDALDDHVDGGRCLGVADWLRNEELPPGSTVMIRRSWT